MALYYTDNNKSVAFATWRWFLQKYIPLLKKVTLFENIEDSDMLAMLKCLGARIHFYKKVKFR